MSARRAVRRAAVPCCLLLSLLTFAALGGSAAAQEPSTGAVHGGPTEAMPDVPTGSATLRGQVVHADRSDAPAADVEVVLYSLGRDGAPGVRRATTDGRGEFRFEAISSAPDVVYLLGARHAGLPFPGDRVVFEEGETERVVEIRVSDPSQDASQVEVVQSSLRVEWTGDRLSIGEVHRLRNRGNAVFHVAPAARAGRTAPLHAQLPEGATEFSMPLGLVPEGAIREDRDFRFWGPLYPGEQEISFRYEVPVEAGLVDLEKRFQSAAGRIRVFGREGGPLEAVEGLEAQPVVEDEGQRFQAFEREPGPAGFVALLRLRIPEITSEPGVLSLVETQMVLEVDDVTLRAQEQHQILVSGPAAARAPEGELILRLPIPDGAADVRFAGDAGGLGLVRTAEGVGLSGPLAPGEHAVGLSYTLRSGPDGASFVRAFDRRLPLLRAYVADTGVVVETNRLHRRRPVRDADRTFLVFEAFEIEAGEPLEFSLRPLPPRVSSRQPALLAAILAGVAAALFLVAPLRGGDERGAGSESDLPDQPATRREREHVYESIRDLDHDYETGKLLQSDWESLRAELRARAVELLAEERRAQTSPPAAAATPARPLACPACTAEPRPGDRFCSRCGAALTAEPESA